MSEGKDLFGMDRASVPSATTRDNEGPVRSINSDMIIERMMGRKLGDMEAFSKFHDHIQWGMHPGSVQMVITPLGSFKSIIRKLQEDLHGEKVWVCKKIIPYKEILDASEQLDEEVSDEIFEKIMECWVVDSEAPDGEYKGLERLSVKVAERCRSKEVKPEIMVFRGVRRMKMGEHYNIHFEVSGQGVEAPGSSRVEQFSIEMVYDKGSGMIRSFGHDIQSPTKGHVWYPQPSEWDENFSPNQNEKEIVEAIAAAFSTY